MPGSTAPSALFVYGTLLEGQANAGLLAGVPRRIATIEGRLWMAPAGYPALVVEAGAGPIAGELVEVDAGRLAVLDVLEGVPRGLYTRAKHDVRTRGATVSAFVYAITEREARARGYRSLTTRDWRHLSR
jgi:gamma-glutamylcyclotransferase (GGCT)/AIG2-like uncharacterized protein YtfP